MKSDLLKQIRSAFTPKKVKSNKRILIFFFFVLLSSFIWLLNNLEKEYFTQISIPVRFYNYPKSKIQLAPLPEQITVTVFGRGFSLLRYKILTFSTIDVDVDKQLVSHDYADKEMVFFNTENLLPALDNEVYGEFKILSIEPKNVQLIFTSKSSKKVTLVPNISYSLNKNYLIDSVYINPKQVLLSGPTFLLDTIDTLYTVPMRIKDVHKDLIISSRIQPIAFCDYNANYAKVVIKLQQKTEKQIYISAASFYKGDTNKVKFIPAQIKITFNVGVHDYNSIQAHMFQLLFDYKHKSIAHASDCFVKLISSPAHVSEVKISPSYVTIIKL